MKNILKFNDHDDFLNKTQGSDKLVSMCAQDLDTHVHYGQDTDYINECFSIKILSGSNGKVELKYNPSIATQSINVATVPVRCNSETGEIYTSDGSGNSQEVEGISGVITISGLNAGDQIWLYIIKDYSAWTDPDTSEQHGCIQFNMTGCTVSLQGNLMSIFAKTALSMPTENTSMPAYMCYAMFCFGDIEKTIYGSTTATGNECIIYANNLILPLKTLPSNACRSMFNCCFGLKSIPKLPATTLGTYCYYYMFFGCIELKDISYLKLDTYTLPNHVYEYMFYTCPNLKHGIKTLRVTDSSGSGSTSYTMAYMFARCSSLEIAPELYLTTSGRWQCSSMFKSCSSLKTVPVLNRTGTAGQYAFTQMVRYCTSLTYFPELNGTFNGQHHFTRAFSGCSSLKYAPKINISALSSYQFYYAFENCTSLEYVDASSILTRSHKWSTHYWMSGAKNNAACTFIKNENSFDWTDVPTSSGGILSNWTVITVSEPITSIYTG